MASLRSPLMGSDPPLTYLVRHGEVLNPQHVVYADLDGFGLSETGRAQAAAAAARLPAGAAIVSSPLERAQETATVVADAVDGGVTIDEDLTEWRLASRWAGHRWSELDEVFPGERIAYLRHPRDLPFSPESLDELADRAAGAIRRRRAATEAPLVVVSHQDPIQAARLVLTGRSLDALNTGKPDHASIITLRDSGRMVWTEHGLWAPPAGKSFPPREDIASGS